MHEAVIHKNDGNILDGSRVTDPVLIKPTLRRLQDSHHHVRRHGKHPQSDPVSPRVTEDLTATTNNNIHNNSSTRKNNVIDLQSDITSGPSKQFKTLTQSMQPDYCQDSMMPR